ncbi:hypothetical protein ABFS82_11G130900 [Erythranthe guttata]|uniref:uncharacterized protein LOC105960875 n=1 Tax=Erythranthe guttata TaxID=4155 RepID=UPI00064DEE5C|nr:PREDICTED: uncharacterized protein LOC105960875 [Erythranthe guttata]|eukprot:XP_012840541.1 PREDICTED: uncharacterized protein LOC105960875 [Erythranthe guttata]
MEKFEFLRKSMESYKYELACAIGGVPMQFILNHPYPPNSSVPIPNETLKDEKLLEAWPQIEQQILEWRKIVYLLSYLLRAHTEERIPCLDTIRAALDQLRADEKINPNCPDLQERRAFCEFVLQNGLDSVEHGNAYQEHTRAYAIHQNDLATMEWYAKHASTYLPSPEIMLQMLFAMPMNGLRFPYPLDGQRHMQNFHAPWIIYDGKPTLDCGPEDAEAEEELHMMQQFQQLQLHDKQQQQPPPPPAWGTNGLMHIRMITALLPP